MSLNRNGNSSVQQQNKKQLISSFQCQRCRMALVPHKSLIDLKPAQFNLLTSSLQLAVDTKNKQHSQRQKLKSNTNGSRTSSKLRQGNTLFGFNWYSTSDEPDISSSGYWGLSNLPAETQNLLFSNGVSGSGSSVAGSFIAIPDTQTVQAEQQKSLKKHLLAGAKDDEDERSTTDEDDDDERKRNIGKTRKATKNDYIGLNNDQYTVNTAPIKNLASASKVNNNLHGGNDGVFSSTTMTLETLFNIISSKSEIDYPVCSDCAEALKNGLKQKYEEDCKERDTYIKFFSQLQAESEAHFNHHPDSSLSSSSSGLITSSNNHEVQELNKEIEELNRQNEQSLHTLKQAETQQEELEKELKELRKELKSLQVKEEDYYRTKNQFALEVNELVKENDRISSVKAQDQKTLERLKKVNTFNDVFCIGFDGSFGTINGLRLGKMRDRQVEWPEINAAWGQVVLLLATIVNKLGIKLNGYRLRPQGSTSKIEQFDLDPKTGECIKITSLELYSSADNSFERLLNRNRYDSALVALLAVFKQIEDFLKARDPGVKIPYAISNDKIGDITIRLYHNTSNENWTKACKHVLTNAKWILAYVSII